MRLTPMRFKEFTWPHNPEVYSVEYRRRIAVHQVPFGGCVMQELGGSYRVLKGEGVFAGEGAYQRFRELAEVFRSQGPGLLVHPVWQTSNAFFVELSLKQEPRADYVRYTFAFWEGYEGHSTGIQVSGGEKPSAPSGGGGRVWHTVQRGETMWGIARDNGLSLTQLIALNPQIKNPNLILVGEKVRLA